MESTKLGRFRGIAKRRVDRTNTEKECKAYEERLILEISNSLEKDIINGIKEKLTESHKDKKTDDELNGLFIHVYFVLLKKGLELRIYGIQPSNEASQVFDYAEFQGCTSEHALKIEEARVKMFEVLKQNQNSLILSEFRKRLFEKYPFLFQYQSRSKQNLLILTWNIGGLPLKIFTIVIFLKIAIRLLVKYEVFLNGRLKLCMMLCISLKSCLSKPRSSKSVFATLMFWKMGIMLYLSRKYSQFTCFQG